MRRTCRHGSKWNNYIENAVDRNRDARFLGCFFALKNLSMPRNQHVLEFFGQRVFDTGEWPFGVLYGVPAKACRKRRKAAFMDMYSVNQAHRGASSVIELHRYHRCQHASAPALTHALDSCSLMLAHSTGRHVNTMPRFASALTISSRSSSPATEKRNCWCSHSGACGHGAMFSAIVPSAALLIALGMRAGP